MVSAWQEPSPTQAAQRVDELAGLGTWVLDLGTNDLVASDVVRLLLELPPDAPAPVLADWFRTVHPDDRPALAEVWRQMVTEGREYVLEHRIVVGGVVKHVRAVACYDATRHRVHGITQDVTAARAAAEEVLLERDLVEGVLAALHEAVLVTDGDVVLRANPAVSTVTGFPAEELVGRQAPYPFWPPQEAGDLQAVSDALVRAGGGEAQVRLQHADGHCLPALLGARPLDGRGRWVLTLRDRSQEHAHEQSLLHRAETDPLTGVLNSRGFRDRLHHEVQRSASTGAPVSLALLDVDHFKQVNDRHGHAVGDEVLRVVVDRLVTAVGRRGLVARVGGEEFAVLLPGLPAAPAHGLLEEVLAAVRADTVGEVGTVTVSAGVAQLDGLDDDGLYRLADRLLYEAKSRGRDQVR